MIGPEYCLTMARYNAWQNKQVQKSLRGMESAALTEDRGAFFGSILGTLNHLLWGDALWMSRFDGGEAFGGGIPHSTELTQTAHDWAVERFRLDSRIILWAEQLTSVALSGNLTWYSGAIEQDVTRPLVTCVVHMFNHQTHHRGQVHAMLTAAGVSAPVTDLPFMPQEEPWL
ncbi:MAG: damage-inducible protein DinB [Rhodobacterales bacterium]|nr:MAG: damage-inducible protein DinB [Rhodobacterales bacterium]